MSASFDATSGARFVVVALGALVDFFGAAFVVFVFVLLMASVLSRS
jgi:hypothetical protein